MQALLSETKQLLHTVLVAEVLAVGTNHDPPDDVTPPQHSTVSSTSNPPNITVSVHGSQLQGRGHRSDRRRSMRRLQKCLDNLIAASGHHAGATGIVENHSSNNADSNDDDSVVLFHELLDGLFRLLTGLPCDQDVGDAAITSLYYPLHRSIAQLIMQQSFAPSRHTFMDLLERIITDTVVPVEWIELACFWWHVHDARPGWQGKVTARQCCHIVLERTAAIVHMAEKDNGIEATEWRAFSVALLEEFVVAKAHHEEEEAFLHALTSFVDNLMDATLDLIDNASTSANVGNQSGSGNTSSTTSTPSNGASCHVEPRLWANALDYIELARRSVQISMQVDATHFTAAAGNIVVLWQSLLGPLVEMLPALDQADTVLASNSVHALLHLAETATGGNKHSSSDLVLRTLLLTLDQGVPVWAETDNSAIKLAVAAHLQDPNNRTFRYGIMAACAQLDLSPCQQKANVAFRNDVRGMLQATSNSNPDTWDGAWDAMFQALWP